MTVLRQVAEGVSRWIDSVVGIVLAVLDRLVARSAVQLVEQQQGGVFTLQGRGQDGSPSAEQVQIADGQIVGQVPAGLATALRGSRVELVLQPGRFMFRPLELPKRAAEFLDGIVRAQIDRLTPWSPTEAVFGWTRPAEAGPERIAVTVAATARAMIMPLVQALATTGATSVAVSTVAHDPASGTLAIKVFDESARGALDARRIRRVLVGTLLVAGLVAAAAVGTAAVMAGTLGHRQDELARRIIERRSAMLGGRDGALDAATAAQRALERRKHESPLTVIVVETLSRILPDHTYVTELRIEGDTLRLVGMTRDAPSLIGLLEQSSQFSRATFFAPTTRSPNESGERFHIEARIEPIMAPRS
jgi:general secretion pathway protein L